MGPPRDNRRQEFLWSCYGEGPGDLFTATETFLLPSPAGRVPADDPRATADAWLAAAGFASPETARERLRLPEGRRVVAAWDPRAAEPCPAFVAEGVRPGVPTPEAAVRNALILSLCSAHLYDPDGPILWTVHRLRRQVRLGRPLRFHEPG